MINTFMRLQEIIAEKIVPDKKPLDYTIQVSSDELSSMISVGTKVVKVAMSIGPLSVSPVFIKLVNPKVVQDRSIRCGDLAFEVGNSEEDITDQKNTGLPIKETIKIVSAVTYIADDMVYKHRSMLPFISFWCRFGENRDKLYGQAAEEFTARWKSRGYVRLNPEKVMGNELPYSFWLWGQGAAFSNGSSIPWDSIKPYLL